MPFVDESTILELRDEEKGVLWRFVDAITRDDRSGAKAELQLVFQSSAGLHDIVQLMQEKKDITKSDLKWLHDKLKDYGTVPFIPLHSDLSPPRAVNDDGQEPMDGLCRLSKEVGNFTGYKVIFYEGDGPAHVQTKYGIYSVNLEEFARDHNVIIIHDDEDYKERLIEDLIQFLNQRVPVDMMVNVLSREGMSLTSSDLMFQKDAVDALVRDFFQTRKDIVEIKAIKSKFLELLENAPPSDEEDDVYEETDFASTAIPEGAVLDETEVATTVEENAEPEDEPTATGWTLVLEFTVANAKKQKDLPISPDATLARLRKSIAEVVFANHPNTTKKMMAGTDLVLTALNPEKVIGGGNVRVKTALTNGRLIRVAFRARGGARSIKPTKKDAKMEKSMGYKKALDEASANVNRQVLNPLQFVGEVEKNLQAFAGAIQNNAEDAVLKALSTFTIAQLDEMTKDVSQKGGSVEGKIVKYAGTMLGLQNVIEAHRSLDCVIQSAENLMMMAVSKTAGEGSDLVAFKKLIERARYVKMGQESMSRGSASQQDDAML